jgi:uncharacterized protein YdeI (YjbR/CyaY-like superfamily)
MISNVDKFLVDGCMRCKYGATPQCKVRKWNEELVMLRHIILECGLEETIKWGFPCYMDNGKNILVIGAFKDYVTISFFKGALLKDPHGILQQPGENSRSFRLFKFTNTDQILRHMEFIKEYVLEAVEIEKSGLKIKPISISELPVPEELKHKFEEIPALKTAFYALTPGRQRGYLLYFSEAKQSKTRESRINKYMQKIFEGKGMSDS